MALRLLRRYFTGVTCVQNAKPACEGRSALACNRYSRQHLETSYQCTASRHPQFFSREYCNGASSPIDMEVAVSSPSSGTMKEKMSGTPDKVVGKISERHNLAMIYTCNVCQTRSAKTMSRETYEKGVVIVRCGGCNNLHLIADRLGWFGEPGSVEDFLKQKGLEVRKGAEESYEFTAEDLAGWTSPVISRA